MTAFDDAARVIDNLTRRVEQLESQLRTLRGEKDGPPRTAYTVPEVAAMVGKTPATVREWIRDGRLEAENMAAENGGRGWWAIPVAAAEALVPRKSA
jgi:hypothetical protein